MIYYVDVDNTICYSPTNDYTASTPWFDRINRMNALYDAGHQIHYWTARGMSSGIDWTQLTLEQFADWGVKYTSLNMGKPSYDIWIDDKAIHCEDFFK